MTVRTGGYQTGMSYRWYRSMGHNPVSALHMMYAWHVIGALWFVLMGLLGFVLGGL